MDASPTIWDTPTAYLRARSELAPVLFFAPAVLHATAVRFRQGFPGLVTYAVKANPDQEVIANLDTAGIGGFDVASLAEIRMLRRLLPDAPLQFNNPVRSRAEIREALGLGVRSFSVDSHSELAKLTALAPPGCEVAVRFKLPVSGAVYDFGAKFGAIPDVAAELLSQVGVAGHRPSLTFHPGTQCTDPAAWSSYISTAAEIARNAGVRLFRLNVGGGFPSHRHQADFPPLDAIFEAIEHAVRKGFGADCPVLMCEPGRALVAEAFALAAPVRAVRDDKDVFLDDGVYGGLAEFPTIGTTDRFVVLEGGTGLPRTGKARPRTVFGPTCDSLDRLPGALPLPEDVAEGDVILFRGMGAYSTATLTRFNGFGDLDTATVLRFTP